MKVVVFTGAGVSQKSGIQVSPDDNGAWESEKWKEYSTPEAWDNNPQKVLDFYNWRRMQLGRCKPNPAHQKLAALQREHQVYIITQNIDNLHERAGSAHVLHIHGELTKIRPVDTFKYNDGYNSQYIKDIGYASVKLGDCGGPNNTQYRPHILFFGESMPKEYLEAQNIIYGNPEEPRTQAADVLLVIGTSLRVEPASFLITHAVDSSFCRTYIIDPRDSPANSLKQAIHIKKEAYEGLIEWHDVYSKIDESSKGYGKHKVPRRPFYFTKRIPMELEF